MSIRHRFPSVTTLGGISCRLDLAMNRRTASVVPLMAFPRTSFFGFAATAVCAAAGMAASTDAAAIEAAVPRPTSARNSLRFNRMFILAGNNNPPS